MLKQIAYAINPLLYESRLCDAALIKTQWASILPLFYHPTEIQPGTGTTTLHLFESKYKVIAQDMPCHAIQDIRNILSFAFLSLFISYYTHLESTTQQQHKCPHYSPLHCDINKPFLNLDRKWYVRSWPYQNTSETLFT
jgi:hypothetical protein